MDATIKIGGSLANYPEKLRQLGSLIFEMSAKNRFIIVPGGGSFSDVVREMDKKFDLSSQISHEMAILGMDQYGLLLTQIIPNSKPIYSIREAIFSEIKEPLIFLPSQELSNNKELESSWRVTSDSIAAFVAIKTNSQKLILVTDVDGIYDMDPKKFRNTFFHQTIKISELIKKDHRTSVDLYLPRFLSNNFVESFVVNGRYPERINDILLGKKVICTRIIN